MEDLSTSKSKRQTVLSDFKLNYAQLNKCFNNNSLPLGLDNFVESFIYTFEFGKIIRDGKTQFKRVHYWDIENLIDDLNKLHYDKYNYEEYVNGEYGIRSILQILLKEVTAIINSQNKNYSEEDCWVCDNIGITLRSFNNEMVEHLSLLCRLLCELISFTVEEQQKAKSAELQQEHQFKNKPNNEVEQPQNTFFSNIGLVVIVVIATGIVFLGIYAGTKDILSAAKNLGNGNIILGLIKLPIAVFLIIQIIKVIGLWLNNIEESCTKRSLPFYIIAIIIGVVILFI